MTNNALKLASAATDNHKGNLNYIEEDEITLGADGDSVEVISDGDVSACIDGWLEKRHVEAAEHRVGVLSQVLLDINSLATERTIEHIRCFVG
jgi:hypothetical protein